MANKYSGYAAILQISISAAYTAIAGVRDISGPSMAMEPIDVSSRDLAWKSFVAGMRDGGEIKFDCVFDSDTATHSATVVGGFIKEFVDGTIGAYKLIFSDTTPVVATFSAMVVKVEPKDPYNGAQTADVTLKITGAIIFA
jgi:hypothetical protein